MSKLWLLTCLPALVWGVMSVSATPARERSSKTYRCAEGRVVVALERARFVTLMVRGRSYDLLWTSETVAQGRGLEWRIGPSGASLRRDASGSLLAYGCGVRE